MSCPCENKYSYQKFAGLNIKIEEYRDFDESDRINKIALIKDLKDLLPRYECEQDAFCIKDLFKNSAELLYNNGDAPESDIKSGMRYIFSHIRLAKSSSKCSKIILKEVGEDIFIDVQTNLLAMGSYEQQALQKQHTNFKVSNFGEIKEAVKILLRMYKTLGYTQEEQLYLVQRSLYENSVALPENPEIFRSQRKEPISEMHRLLAYLIGSYLLFIIPFFFVCSHPFPAVVFTIIGYILLLGMGMQCISKSVVPVAGTAGSCGYLLGFIVLPHMIPLILIIGMIVGILKGRREL
ncbi:MAG: hypothetical protein K8T10_04000 [Candidatus Eremiobacteraeota bacterium]|nr:hypothetical protein [Candidatus Eremiobacteraeota bacterium]